MSTSSVSELLHKRCVPCEGGVPPVPPEQARKQLQALPEWSLSENGKEIQRKWTLADFAAGLEFIQKVGQLAEEEQHHPDIHLTGYRNLRIVLSTHAIGGLSENDFIVAAKIDQLPVKLKKK